jgi:DNA-binding NarL/FixJ family response regulator
LLRVEAGAGRLDPDVVQAILAAAGHRVSPVRREWPAGLSEREVEVLRLAAQGFTNREMARHLSIAEKTVGHHIQHIYNKLGVSTRAAATLFALQHDLLDDLLDDLHASQE